MTIPSFLSPEFRANPYPFYAALRKEQPVHRVEFPGGQSMWIITRYDDAMAASKDPRLIKNWRKVMTPEQGAALGLRDVPSQNTLANADPPDHTRLRALVQKVFTAPFVERMRGRIQETADGLIDNVKARGQMDLIDAFAFPLPIVVISDMMGIPSEDHHRIREWSAATSASANRGSDRVEGWPKLDAFIAYLRELSAARRKSPGDDLVSRLIAAEEEGQKLNESELIGMLFILLFAGHETTVNLIANSMLALLTHPAELARLKADPSLLKPAIEECLRWSGPVETSLQYFASEDLEIGGAQIRRGEVVVIGIISANHDATQFDRPAELDIARENNKHLAFGHGIHYCLGAPLARLEGQIAVSTLLRRLPDLRLAVPPAELRYRPSILMRGLVELPVAFTPQP